MISHHMLFGRNEIITVPPDSGGGDGGGGGGGTVEPTVAHANFDALPVTGYGNASTMESLINQDFALTPFSSGSYSEGESKLVDIGSGNIALECRYIPLSIGSARIGYTYQFADHNEIWCSWRVKYLSGWEWVQGGKLPGAAGGTQPTGGTQAYTGWSGRLMWHPEGAHIAYLYTYYPDRPNKNGTGFRFKKTNPDNTSLDSDTWYAPTGQWLTFTQRYVMNTAADNFDGIFEGYVDGVLRCRKTNLRWYGPNSYTASGKPAHNKVNGFRLETFYGGGSSDYAPSKTTYAQFDGFKISATSDGVD